ncbi:TonB-dependent receptor [Rhodomicrobium vannielii ATCC 17100]|uniref:TonB-dependent receptor n=1 Tax=Rhodomicrobium vannielii TaxID=1069 RepID=UPI00191A044B|nr:TonB-dependent receptor [Rhodomicrobium vannielii]MBJ7532741.1 TonB-dependent receptor [Rhodomicrobium vannielii ATCC 17100]
MRGTILRSVSATLLFSTALSSVAYGQTTSTPVPANQPAPSGQTAAPATAQSFGTVYATEPVRRPSVALAQPGLTSSPTDYGALLQTTAAATAPGGSGTATEVKVTPGGVTRQDIGGGYMILEQATKTRSTVTRDAIDKQSPTANPYQMINLLPGVIQSSSDNTGLNGGNIRLRGFNSDHVGMTIEGMPVNDSGNYALYPQEYVDSENIQQISIAQGSPDLDSPHVGSAGGVINIYMRDPSKDAGAYASFSAGSDALLRSFTRIESGEINGVSAYVSYSKLSKDHWIGPGSDDREHIDFKAKWELSPGNTIRFAAIYNDALNNFYATPTKAQAGQPYSTWGYNTKTGDSKYYGYMVNPFKNLILSAPSNFTLSQNLKFDTIPYYWYGYGNGGGTSTITESSGFTWGNVKMTGFDLNGNGTTTDSTALRYYSPSITETHRPGVINKFTYDYGNHQIVAGQWFEYAMHHQWGPYAGLNSDGTVADYFADAGGISLTPTICTNAVTGAVTACPTGQIQKRNWQTDTMTNMVFLGDTWKATDKLTVIYGAKQVWVDRTVDNRQPGGIEQSLYDTATLPTAGVRYQLDKDNTVFANFSTSFRSPPNYTLTPAGNYIANTTVPMEEGKSFEIGHRYQGSTFATSVTAFYGTFQNYQVSTYVYDDAGSSQQVTVNAGDVINYGINAELGLRPIYNLRPYVSAELIRTEMLDNALEAYGTIGGTKVNDYLRTSGKQLPGTPNYSFGFGLDYDDDHIIGNIGFKWIGSQYATFMNDETLDSFGRVDAMIGYRFDNFGWLKRPEIKLNIYNIANTDDLTGVYSIKNNAKTTTGVNGSTISSSAPTYYQGQGASFLVTFSTGL